MATVAILGAGVSGHTAALVLRKKLSKEHKVIVISPNSKYQWIPSNIWVGIGRMKSEQVTFSLAPVYKRMGVEFHQAKALSIHPEGDQHTNSPFVSIEYTEPDKSGTQE